MKRSIEGYLICQQKKEHSQKKILDPTSLEHPSTRWGTLETDFIVSFPQTNKGFDSITTLADVLSSRGISFLVKF